MHGTRAKTSMKSGLSALTRRVAAVSLGIALTLGAATAQAQNMFAPVAYVNDDVVTRYELDQRMQFMRVLAGGASEAEVLDALIDERLKMAAARRVGASITDEQTAAAIQEFASRGGLAPEQFMTLMARNGVDAQTVRDFVVNATIWRDYARGRFGSRAQVSESEIDRAISQNGPSGGLRVLLSEIFLPARTPQERAQSEALAKQISSGATVNSFAAAARKYSVSPSRNVAGKMEWVPVGNLPAPLRNAVMGLKPGGVTAPLFTGNAIGFFQLRQLDEVATPTPAPSAIEYAAYYIAGGQSAEAQKRAAQVRAEVDTCNDLYRVAKGQPESVLEIGSKTPAEIPQDVALELAKLDPNESSTALTRANGQTLVFLMLCSRSYPQSEGADREAVRNQLLSSRIGAMAESYLAELRADATIVKP